MTYEEKIETFFSAYPDYVREKTPALVSPDVMRRVNEALDRQAPTPEEWAKEFKAIKPVSEPERPSSAMLGQW